MVSPEWFEILWWAAWYKWLWALCDDTHVCINWAASMLLRLNGLFCEEEKRGEVWRALEILLWLTMLMQHLLWCPRFPPPRCFTLDQSQWLSQEPFEARSATGNEKEKEQPVPWQGWAWGAGFPPAILVLLLSMTTTSSAYQGWSLVFSQVIPGGRIFSQLAPLCSRGYRGCVTCVKRSCDKSCHGSTSAV